MERTIEYKLWVFLLQSILRIILTELLFLRNIMTPTINRKTFISLRPLVLFILFVGILIYSKNNIAQNSGLELTAEESE